MWREYFGPRARIVGIDISPDCAQFADRGTEIYIGDQGDLAFLAQVLSEVKQIDVLLDDGGHTMEQQRVTFDVCFGEISENGVYLCEDLHTSYWEAYGGGFRNPNSFIEYMKSKIDELNGYWTGDAFTSFTRSVASIHFYDSIVAIEKRLRRRPRQFLGINGSVKQID